MPEPIKGLQVIDFLGVFYRDGDQLMVADEFDGARDVGAELLERLGDNEVRVLMHHRPQEPHDDHRWGGGCCQLENTGTCHYGHHENPKNLFVFNRVGVLQIEGPVWNLKTKDGIETCHVDFLVGHRSQVLVTSVPDLDDIEEKVKSFDPSKLEKASVEELSESIAGIRDYLVQLEQLKNGL